MKMESAEVLAPAPQSASTTEVFLQLGAITRLLHDTLQQDPAHDFRRCHDLNALALACGYSFGRLFRVDAPAVRAITFETGIHNTALGLTLVFSYFPSQTGMMLVLGWWGVWHLITGGLLAWFWSRRPASSVP